MLSRGISHPQLFMGGDRFGTTIQPSQLSAILSHGGAGNGYKKYFANQVCCKEVDDKTLDSSEIYQSEVWRRQVNGEASNGEASNGGQVDQGKGRSCKEDDRQQVDSKEDYRKIHCGQVDQGKVGCC